MGKGFAFGFVLLLAGITCLAQAQSPIAGFPPGTFQNRAALDSGASSGPAVAFDACGTNNLVTGTSGANGSLTVSPGLTNSALIGTVIVTGTGPIISPSMTWNAIPMTLVSSVSVGFGTQAFIFGLRNPTAGNQSLAAAWTNSVQVNLQGCSFQNVDQTSDGAAFTNSNSANGTTSGAAAVSITSATGNIAVAAHSILSVANVTAVSGTQVLINNSGSASDAAASFDTGAASVNLTATVASSTSWGSAGVNLAKAP